MPTVPLPMRSPGRSLRIRRRPGDHVAERELRVGPRPAARLGPVDRGRHREVVAGAAARVGQLIRGHQPRTDRAREVLALGRPEADDRLLALEIARRPVVEDRVAADRLLGALGREVESGRVDERRDLELVVELRRRRRRPDRVVRPADLRDVAEVEDRQAVPRPAPRRRAAPTSSGRGPRRRRSRGATGAQYRRPEGEVGGAEDGRVVVVARFEPVDEVADASTRRPLPGGRRASSAGVGGRPSRVRAPVAHEPRDGAPPRGRSSGSVRPRRPAPRPVSTRHRPVRIALERARPSRRRVHPGFMTMSQTRTRSPSAPTPAIISGRRESR